MHRSIILFLVFILSAKALLFAQNFEYTQNKGQWNTEVLFKGDLNNGAIFLKKSGFRVVLHHPDDFSSLLNKYSGHLHEDERKEDKPNVHPTTSLSTVAKQAPKVKEDILRSHAFDLVFLNANPNPKVVASKPIDGVSNYFIGTDPAAWQSNVQSYSEVVYQEMYPGIDVKFFSENGFIKYDLIVHPGGALYKVLIEYRGVQSLSLNEKGDLLVNTTVGQVKEQFPLTYQIVDGKREVLRSKYELYGNKVKFKIPDYNHKLPLVIDPVMVFASFVGGRARNWGYSATYDREGNAYGGGIVFGTGYPTTVGAFQQNFSGGGTTTDATFDVGVVKLSSRGERRLYTTYLGGNNGKEQPHSLFCDSNGDLVISGRTNSSSFPATTRLGTPGGWDIFVTRLNASGTALIGSMVIAGSGDDGVNIADKINDQRGALSLRRNYGDDSRSEVIVDRNGRVVLASCTQSSNLPVTSNAFQKTLSGQQDGVIAIFNNSVTALQTLTYFGGSQNDAAYVLLSSPNGNLYVAGGTESGDFPGDKSGTVQPTHAGGGADGFIAELSRDGTNLLKCTFVGTSGYDQIYGVQTDENSNVYCSGTSTGDFPVRNVAWSQNGGKQFIAKLNPTLSDYVYSTVYGTNSTTPNISPTAFLVDICERVYVTGWGARRYLNYETVGTSGMFVSPDARQTSTDGRDFYLLALEKDISAPLYATFFGQATSGSDLLDDHVDGGTSRFDRRGVIYQAVCADCFQSPFNYPTTPGVVAPTNQVTGSQTCNELIFKFAFELSGVEAAVRTSINGVRNDTIGCVPLTVVFTDSIASGKTYVWDFGDGSPQQTTTAPTTSHEYLAVGQYLVTLRSIDQSKCRPEAISTVTITVGANRALLSAVAVKLPPCEDLTFRFDNNSTASLPFNSNNFSWNFGDGSPVVVAGTEPVQHTFPAQGTYSVKMYINDDRFCNAPDTLTIPLRISPIIDARFTVTPGACAPEVIQFENLSLGGETFQWIFHDGSTSNSINASKQYDAPGTYPVTLIAQDPNSCNLINRLDTTVQIFGYPVASFNHAPQPPIENTPTNFTNTSTEVTRYYWDFGDGTTLFTTRRDTLVEHQYRRTGTYNVCLDAINENNCAATTCMPVEAIINQSIDVVSAFTPNGDGKNDLAVVRGYGIESILFRIYNRWGQLVYESQAANTGWDGNFNGKAQPMDAYAYTLEAKMIDNSTVKRSGSITLIR